MITVYSLPHCPNCDKSKKYLTNKQTNYQEIDLTGNPEALARVKGMGFTQAPIIEQGDQIHTGFNPKELDKMIAQEV